MSDPVSVAKHPKHHRPAHAHRREAGAIETPQTPVPAGTIYTCPMHPQIRQVGPGHCPICGMALEPEVGAQTGPNPDLINITRRLSTVLPLAPPALALAMRD